MIWNRPGEDQDGHYNPKLLVCQPCQKGGNGADAMGGVIDCETVSFIRKTIEIFKIFSIFFFCFVAKAWQRLYWI